MSTPNTRPVTDEIKTRVERNTVTIWRERRPTAAERDADGEARVMVEVVTISFGPDEPFVTVNRNLCA